MKRSNTRTEATSPPVRTRRARDAVEEASDKAVGGKRYSGSRSLPLRTAFIGGWNATGDSEAQPLAPLPWGLPVDLGTAGHLLPSPGFCAGVWEAVPVAMCTTYVGCDCLLPDLTPTVSLHRKQALNLDMNTWELLLWTSTILSMMCWCSRKCSSMHALLL